MYNGTGGYHEFFFEWKNCLRDGVPKFHLLLKASSTCCISLVSIVSLFVVVKGVFSIIRQFLRGGFHVTHFLKAASAEWPQLVWFFSSSFLSFVSWRVTMREVWFRVEIVRESWDRGLYRQVLHIPLSGPGWGHASIWPAERMLSSGGRRDLVQLRSLWHLSNNDCNVYGWWGRLEL